MRYKPFPNLGYPPSKSPGLLSALVSPGEGPARASVALAVSMLIRNPGEIVSRLLPRLWTTRHFGRRRVDSATFNGCRKLCSFPAVRLSSRSDSFHAASHPSFTTATWGAAASLTNGASHSSRNSPHYTTIPATPAATSTATATTSPTFLWSWTLNCNGNWPIPVSVRSKSESEAQQPCRTRRASTRHPRSLKPVRRFRHLSLWSLYRTRIPSCATTTVTTLSASSDYRRTNSSTSPPPPTQSTAVQDAANNRLR